MPPEIAHILRPKNPCYYMCDEYLGGEKTDGLLGHHLRRPSVTLNSKFVAKSKHAKDSVEVKDHCCARRFEPACWL